ncbi:MAG TPA: MarR family winged helix-turn-helix transcriptional regulator [Rhodopila sp.]|uniref:MarR family winged helix-turn-helix transcriptional regulator n=1 Tax=Rhodopila sp. TaxID=2480087 RepID=UPI002BCC9067|nr:MarR family winged helix-turn-helix transcriptional regulator [Rhodopila sp.]HVY17788.1 MarR family winged helix-turn-helix transcriptional regulator [Rhodopila sp.]
MPALTRAQYVAIAAFRYRLRRFLAFSEAAASAVGLAPQQHQALLALAGHVGEEAPGVGAVAEALLIAPHSAAELVARMVEAGLLTKTRSTRDRRKVDLRLTEQAEALLRTLTEAHLAELRTLGPALAEAIGTTGAG